MRAPPSAIGCRSAAGSLDCPLDRLCSRADGHRRTTVLERAGRSPAYAPAVDTSGSSRPLPAFAVPYPVRIGLAVLATALGLVLLANPTADVATLTRLIGAALVVLGANRMASATERPGRTLAMASGGIWLGVGLVVVVAPSLGVRTVAILAGAALVVGGAVDLARWVATKAGRDLPDVADLIGIAFAIVLGLAAG